MIWAVEKLAAVSASTSDREREVPSFEQIYARWFHDVSRWVRAFGGLDADLDDLTQEVFIVVRRKLSSFDGDNLKGWLYCIAKRQVRDYLRRAAVRRVFQSRGPEDHGPDLGVCARANPDPSEALERRDIERFLIQTLRKMSHAQRTAFLLFEIEGFSGEEIAELEGIPIKTVWTRLHHARRHFFELIDEAKAEGRLP